MTSEVQWLRESGGEMHLDRQQHGGARVVRVDPESVEYRDDSGNAVKIEHDEFGRHYRTVPHVLADAMRRVLRDLESKPTVFMVHGEVGGLKLQADSIGRRSDEVTLQDAPFRDVLVTGEEASQARVEGITFGDQGSGGVDQVFFKDVVVGKHSDGSAYCISTQQNSKSGKIGFEGVFGTFKPSASGGYDGCGVKSVLRTHGSCSLYLRDFSADSAQEHLAYLDRLNAGTSYKASHLYDLDIGRAGRTVVQLTNRAASHTLQGQVVAGGASGHGSVCISRVRAKALDRSIAGGGGSAVSVYGHGGHVIVDDVEIEDCNSSLLLVTTDVGKGAHLFTESGYYYGSVQTQAQLNAAFSYVDPLYTTMGIWASNLKCHFDQFTTVSHRNAPQSYTRPDRDPVNVGGVVTADFREWNFAYTYEPPRQWSFIVDDLQEPFATRRLRFHRPAGVSKEDWIEKPEEYQGWLKPGEIALRRRHQPVEWDDFAAYSGPRASRRKLQDARVSADPA